MKIAYFILAHQLPEQLTRLILRLYTSETFVFVLVNKDTHDTEYEKMVEGVRGLANVIFLNRRKIIWGRILYAVVDGINEIFNINEFNFDYMFLLSGQDYQIKDNSYISDFLCKNKGKQFIYYFPIPHNTPADPDKGLGWEDERGGLERIENWYIWLFGKNYPIPGERKSSSRIKSFIQRVFALILPKRKFVKGFKPFGGSTWWCLTRECLTYIHNFIIDNPHFVRYFKYVKVPEEIFYQTIILNSPFKDSVVNDDLRCIDWPKGDWHPRIFRTEDFDFLKSSKGLIARKFDSRIDSEILDLIDNDLLSTQGAHTPNDRRGP